MNSTVELWKKHPDYTEIEVSSFGRVRSAKGHYYKISSTNSGYLQVGISASVKNVSKLVHRLVAQTFIPNPNNLPQVNHKDGDLTNNNVSNIEWCTRSYNIKPVFAINLTTLEVLWFQSQHEAGRVLGVKQGSISSVIGGKTKQTCGYWFMNADEEAVDIVKSKLHDIGKTGLKVKCQSVH